MLGMGGSWARLLAILAALTLTASEKASLGSLSIIPSPRQLQDFQRTGATCASLSHVSWAELEQNGLPEGVSATANAWSFTELQLEDSRGAEVIAAALTQPDQSTMMPHIQRPWEMLGVRNSELTPRGAQAIFQAALRLGGPVPRVLDLGLNRISDGGLRCLPGLLAEWDSGCGLEEVNFRFNSISFVGARALASALTQPGAGNLTRLYLGGNPIGDDGAVALALALRKTPASIQVLDLRRCEISDRGLQALARALRHQPALTHLDISGNSFSPEGIQSLVKAMTRRKGGKNRRRPLSGLRYLDLRRCGLSDDAAALLAKALSCPECGLSALHLAHNKIGPRGVHELIDGLSAASGDGAQVDDVDVDDDDDDQGDDDDDDAENGADEHGDDDEEEDGEQHRPIRPATGSLMRLVVRGTGPRPGPARGPDGASDGMPWLELLDLSGNRIEGKPKVEAQVRAQLSKTLGKVSGWAGEGLVGQILESSTQRVAAHQPLATSGGGCGHIARALRLSQRAGSSGGRWLRVDKLVLRNAGLEKRHVRLVERAVAASGQPMEVDLSWNVLDPAPKSKGKSIPDSLEAPGWVELEEDEDYSDDDLSEWDGDEEDEDEENEENGRKERERRRGGTKVSSGRWRGANSDTELDDMDGDISEFFEDFNSDEEPDDFL